MSFSRRGFLQVSACVSMSGWLGRLAATEAPAAGKKRGKSVILIWCNGGPSTIDLWDVKEGHSNGGPTKSIATSAPGLRISEHLPKLAKVGKELAVIRSMSTREGDHNRATYLMHTGQLPLGVLAYPSIGSLISKELGDTSSELPNFISIAPQRFFGTDAFGSGFLGPKYAPLIIGENRGDGADFKQLDAALQVDNLHSQINPEQNALRYQHLRTMQDAFGKSHPGAVSEGHTAAYDRSRRLMESSGATVFELSKEKDKVREKYGKSIFGQGCLLARRLVEAGVPFIEINAGFWDTHNNNFEQMKTLGGRLDTGFAALVEDLKERGLLDSTMIVCMGEFGRTPRINGSNGRDHYPNAWSAVLAGGGLKTGQAVGKTSEDGTMVEGRKTSVGDLLATICKAVNINGEKQNMSNIGRPIRIVDRDAQPIEEVFA
jgi:hypothetical protein